jgi:hypothetical protein
VSPASALVALAIEVRHRVTLSRIRMLARPHATFASPSASPSISTCFASCLLVLSSARRLVVRGRPLVAMSAPSPTPVETRWGAPEGSAPTREARGRTTACRVAGGGVVGPVASRVSVLVGVEAVVVVVARASFRVREHRVRLGDAHEAVRGVGVGAVGVGVVLLGEVVEGPVRWGAGFCQQLEAAGGGGGRWVLAMAMAMAMAMDNGGVGR